MYCTIYILHCAVQSRHLTSLTTSYTYFRHFLNQPAKKLVNSLAFSYQQRRQRRTLGEKLLPPLRFHVEEEALCVEFDLRLGLWLLPHWAPFL